MLLDLDDLTHGWNCPPGEMRARAVMGRDGQELLQIRIDVGLMQMLLTERPDGQRYHGLPTAAEYVQHELRVGGHTVRAEDWAEVRRELQQLNYRRLAYAAVAEGALEANETEQGERCLHGALADIEACLQRVRLLREHERDLGDAASLEPTLVFEQARLAAQLRLVESRFEEAVEEAEAGAARLAGLLDVLGYDDDLREEDPGVQMLAKLARQVRREYGIEHTLRERLNEALEREDFETAARLRDEMKRRTAQPQRCKCRRPDRKD